MFETRIITSSVCFVEIIRHCIVLRYLLIVLRLLCLLQGILTGKKIGLLFRPINWQLTLHVITHTANVYGEVHKVSTALACKNS